jgi:DNA-binding SARP family transcriptional activator
VATERLAIHLLGDFRVTVGSRVIDEREWISRKARSLVKLLALAGLHRLHREHIMDQLWPEMGPEEAANNLHKVLYVVRHILEPDLPRGGTSSYLQLRHGVLALEAPEKPWIDVEAFEAAARVARELRTARAYTAALQLYTGDLVPEDRYEDWVAAYRERLRGLRVTLLIGLAGAQEQAGDIAAAIETLQQVVASDPVHEQAHGILMRLWVHAGQRHLALRQYQVLRAALQRELDAEPDARLQALYQDMRASHPAQGAWLPAHDDQAVGGRR